MNQFWINGKATLLNSVAGPSYLLLPTGLAAAETATATWGVLAFLQFPIVTLQPGRLLKTRVLKRRIKSEQVGVTCSLNILFVTLFCCICFAFTAFTCYSLPGLKKKRYVLFFSLQGGRSRSVPRIALFCRVTARRSVETRFCKHVLNCC